MSSETVRKSRSANFTKEEELLLLKEIYKLREVIECKVTNKYSIAEKDKVWEAVACHYNAKNFQYRTTDQLRSKYDNLKTKARKEVAKKRAHFKGTGGGPSSDDSFDAVIEAVLKILNVKTVAGLESQRDSDAFETFTPIKQATAARVPPILSLSPPGLSLSPETPSLSSPKASPDTAISALDESSNQLPVEVKIEVCEIEDSQKKARPEVAMGSRRRKRPISSVNWATYVPRKLKTPGNRKLRPTVANPVSAAKERYYEKKADYFEAEAEAKRKWTVREEEEHVRKIKLLDLEIKIKEQQLQKNLIK